MNAPNTTPPDLEAWLADFPDLAPGDLEPAWRLAEDADPTATAPPPDPTRIRAIQHVLQRATAEADARPWLRLVQPARMLPWMALAASVVLLLAAGLFWYRQPVTWTAPTGQTVAAHLPDGSTVHLNRGAALRYARAFGRQHRHVELEGEAFFDVARAETPFVIETFNASVTVLGTQFNVRAWPDESEARTVVAVVSGVVRVAAHTGQPIVLHPGQTTSVARRDAAPQPPSAARLDEATAWRNGGFIFYDQPFAVLLDEIEHRFGIDITASETVRARRLTISRHKIDSAENLVKDLCQSAGLRYRATANGFLVYQP